ncbi:MAG: hypothetical protein A2X59_12005 [Nitrospirae bacterium GWC2_42_7]|nr:MAG: hypothetical protein A2X59_12005 [Nitrospirae bacterium GWC2_42_7]
MLINNNDNKLKSVGGQAVIEGVMMKSPKNWTVAVRDQKGNIHIKKEKLTELPRFWKLPVLRGVVALGQALGLGIKAIEFSASKAYEEESEKGMGKFTMSITILISILLGIALFILLPLYITKLIGLLVHNVTDSSFLFNLTDGIVRIVIFLLYVVLIGRWKEMSRIFEYHGAEHKVIHAYEAGKELTLENVRNFSPLHPRCGTSFLMIVMVVSIMVFSFIPQHLPFLYIFLSRIILIPLIAGFSYEFLKFSAKWENNALMSILIQPGLFLQKLTTREPDDAQLEVALRSLIEVLELEENNA